MPFNCGWLDNRSFQIMTVNQKSTPEPTTKKKLASEVAKLVERCIEGIRVSAVFQPRLSFPDAGSVIRRNQGITT